MAYKSKNYREGYRNGMLDSLLSISNVFFEQEVYFLQKNGLIYSRLSHKEMKLEDAFDEFTDYLEDSNDQL